MTSDQLPLAAGCPVCLDRDTRPVLECSPVPAVCHLLWRSRDEALQVPRAGLSLRFCDSCGLLYNADFDPELVAYSERYENAQHFSPSFGQFLGQLAESLVQGHQLQGKVIVELGCGDGHFLRLLCRDGRNRGVGFDPAAPVTTAADPTCGVSIIRGRFPQDGPEVIADFVVCRHLLEHLPDPGRLLASVRDGLRLRPGSTLYVEVPDTLHTLQEESVWDLVYEHCLYFTGPSLMRLLGECGFQVVEETSRFGGQLLGVVARPSGAGATPGRTGQHLDRVRALAAGLERRFQAKVSHWRERVRRMHRAGRRIALWGAGTKGVMFLNTVEEAARILWVVDVNPRKAGYHVAGTGQRILAPAELSGVEADVVLVMNRTYEREIQVELRRVGASAEIVVV